MHTFQSYIELTTYDINNMKNIEKSTFNAYLALFNNCLLLF